MKKYCSNCFHELSFDLLRFKEDSTEIDILKMQQYAQLGLELPDMKNFQYTILNPNDFQESKKQKFKKFTRKISQNGDVICGYCHFDIGFELDHFKKNSYFTIIMGTKQKIHLIDQLQLKNDGYLFPRKSIEKKESLHYIESLPFAIDDNLSENVMLRLLLQRMISAGATFVLLLDDLEDSTEGRKHSVNELQLLTKNFLSLESERDKKFHLLFSKPRTENIKSFIQSTITGSIFQNLTSHTHEIGNQEELENFIYRRLS